MNDQKLVDTAAALVAGDRGLLAMDESTPTCNKRFAALGIPLTVETLRAYRDMIVTTPRLGECISGAILYDETLRQTTNQGAPFAAALVAAGIVPGSRSIPVRRRSPATRTSRSPKARRPARTAR